MRFVALFVAVAAVVAAASLRPGANTATRKPAATQPATTAPASQPATAPATAPAATAPASQPAPATAPATQSSLLAVPIMNFKSNALASTAPRPTKAIPTAGCVTGECHPGVKANKMIHGPVNVNACDACHQLTSAERHTFKLARDKTAICTFCHKVKLTGAVVHKPVQTGDCLPCHDPHGAPNGQFLRGQTMNDLCRNCHKDVMAGRKMVHGPVASGACGSCHEPHAANLPKLLVAQGRDLCLNCHAEMKKQMAKAKFVHKAVEADCLTCHEAHASNYPMQTRQAPLELCTSKCHEKIRVSATDAPRKHTIVLQGNSCLNCHTAHGGQLAKLMRSECATTCMKCHDKKIEQDDDRTIAAVPEVLDPTKNKHGPVRQGSCGGCHNVHGGTVSRLLTKPYPDTFYEKFDPAKYELCFSCHNPQLASARETTTVTGFRNGSRNLHAVHVSLPRQGRSCRACHSTHASTNAVHIRESVPYGNWKLPIDFTPTATGGTCASGCHRKLSYDRVKPFEIATRPTTAVAVDVKTPAPLAMPAPVPVLSPTTAPAPTSAPAPTTAPAGSPAWLEELENPRKVPTLPFKKDH